MIKSAAFEAGVSGAMEKIAAGLSRFARAKGYLKEVPDRVRDFASDASEGGKTIKDYLKSPKAYRESSEAGYKKMSPHMAEALKKGRRKQVRRAIGAATTGAGLTGMAAYGTYRGIRGKKKKAASS